MFTSGWIMLSGWLAVFSLLPSLPPLLACLLAVLPCLLSGWLESRQVCLLVWWFAVPLSPLLACCSLACPLDLVKGQVRPHEFNEARCWR